MQQRPSRQSDDFGGEPFGICDVQFDHPDIRVKTHAFGDRLFQFGRVCISGLSDSPPNLPPVDVRRAFQRYQVAATVNTVDKDGAGLIIAMPDDRGKPAGCVNLPDQRGNQHGTGQARVITHERNSPGVTTVRIWTA